MTSQTRQSGRSCNFGGGVNCCGRAVFSQRSRCVSASRFGSGKFGKQASGLGERFGSLLGFASFKFSIVFREIAVQ